MAGRGVVLVVVRVLVVLIIAAVVLAGLYAWFSNM
jgi:hypothetical protein